MSAIAAASGEALVAVEAAPVGSRLLPSSRGHEKLSQIHGVCMKKKCSLLYPTVLEPRVFIRRGFRSPWPGSM